MNTKSNRWNSVNLRLLIIGMLVLLLLIPSGMIGALISERQSRKDEAVQEITSKWANAQRLGGPIITIPYDNSWKDTDGKIKTGIDYVHILPEQLRFSAKLTPQIRHRGIYKAVLYNAKLAAEGSFSLARLGNLGINPQTLHWSEAFVSILIPDMRGIKENIDFLWDGKPYPVEPGIRNGNTLFDSGVSFRVPVNAGTGDSMRFAFKLNLNGSESFSILPLAQTTLVHLESPWPNPSFNGAFLPEKSHVGPQGFTADWKVLDLNRNFPQQWTGDVNNDQVHASAFGVELFTPVDEYAKTSRAIKYIVMFVILTFLIFFLVEVFNRKRIHPIQYLLIGFALCLFYLLLLSLSEQIGFTAAYGIAGVSIVGLITFYVGSALRGRGLPWITGLTLLVLYGFMYVLLQNQDYALLIGSIGLFITMAVVMFLSRKVDWYNIHLKNEGDQPPTELEG
ncbi:MAG TPA: cell envelope integrity protein CreD [Bacillota bacterium]|nr:cell envelope integrity protein CreD [Bacillota bacterium]